MRILVTGAGGQVGSALAEIGVERNLDLVALNREALDVTDSCSIDSAFREYSPDLVINAAAYTAVDKAETDAERAFLINDNGPGLLAEYCARLDIPLFHISTDYVFDGQSNSTYTEKDPVNPLAVYAKSKEAGERRVRGLLNKHIILRTSWVFGEIGNNFVKTMLRLAADRDRITVVDDQVGGPTSARAIAQVLLQIADIYFQGRPINWGTYHFCEKPYVNWYQFATEIIEMGTQLGKVKPGVTVDPIRSSAFPTPVKRPANSRLDTVKIEEALGASVSNWRLNLKRMLLLV